MPERYVPFDSLDAGPREHRQAAQPKPANPAYVPSKLPLIDPITLEGREAPERQWQVRNWIPARAVTMLGGDGGLGKSLLAQMLGTAAAAGLPWLGLETARCKVLGVFCEDEADELHRRQVAINDALGISFADLENFAWVSGVGQDNALHVFDREAWRWEPSAFFQQIHNAAMDGGYQFILLDSLHDLFAGNENSRPEVRRFVQMLHGLALDVEGTVVLTAHPSRAGRSDGSGESGSTAWHNSVRSRLYLEAVKPEDGEPRSGTADLRKLSRRKANYASRDAEIVLRWQAGAFVVEAASPTSWIDRQARENAAEDTFLALLDRTTAEGRHVSHKSRAGNYAPKAFASRADRQGLRREDLARAMERLFEAGKIHVTSAKNEHRNAVEIIARKGEK